MSLTFKGDKFYQDGKEISDKQAKVVLDPETLKSLSRPAYDKLYAERGPVGGIRDLFGSDVANVVEKVRSKLPGPIADMTRSPGVTMGMVGSFISPGVGLAAGAAGNAMEQMQTNGIEAPIDPLAIAGQTGIDTLLNKIGDWGLVKGATKLGTRLTKSKTPGILPFSNEASDIVPGFKGKLAAYLANRGRTLTKEEEAAIHELIPGTNQTYGDFFGLTAAQSTGSPGAQFLEDALETHGKSSVKGTQWIKLQELIAKFRGEQLGTNPIAEEIPQTLYGSEIQAGIKSGRKQLLGEQSAIWGGIKKKLDNATEEFDVVTGRATRDSVVLDLSGNMGKVTEDVIERRAYRGLTDTSNTQAALGQYKPDIDKIFGPEYLANMSEQLRAKYTTVRQQIQNLTTPTMVKDVDGNIVPLVEKEWDKLRDIRTSIGNIIYRKTKSDWDHNDVILGDIYSGLTKDLQKGATDLGFGDLFVSANNLRNIQQGTYPPEVMKFLYINRKRNAYAQDVIPKVADHAEKTLQLWNATPIEQRKFIRGGFLEKAFNEAMTVDKTKFEVFDPSKFYSIINDKNSGYRVVFNSAENKQLNDFAHAVQRMAGKESMIGKTAFEIRRASLMLNLISGTGSSLLQGKTTQGLLGSALGTGAVFAIQDFAKVLLDPNVGKLAIRLAKMDPTTPEAKFATKSILYALRGARVMFDTGHRGIYAPGFIDESGRLQEESTLSPQDTQSLLDK